MAAVTVSSRVEVPTPNRRGSRNWSIGYYLPCSASARAPKDRNKRCEPAIIAEALAADCRNRLGSPINMTTAVVAVFVLVYFGMILGGLPFLQLDRTGIALLGAIAMVGIGALTPEQA